MKIDKVMFIAASGCLTAILFLQLAVSGQVTTQQTAPNDYPPGKLGEVVRLGEDIVMRTSEHPLSKDLVGNSLNCSSCHLDGGRDNRAASFLGVASAYPAWAPREQKVITLEDRILNCFIRSQNGKRPPNGSEVSVSIATYITWLSEGYKIKMNAQQSLGPQRLEMLEMKDIIADVQRGQQLYVERCADCHLEDGSGDSGPPVWGEDSYNDGAGMAKVPKLASWLKVAMPPDDENLTVQEAVDIAAYINSKPRPKFEEVK